MSMESSTKQDDKVKRKFMNQIRNWIASYEIQKTKLMQ